MMRDINTALIAFAVAAGVIAMTYMLSGCVSHQERAERRDAAHCAQHGGVVDYAPRSCGELCEFYVILCADGLEVPL